MKSMLLRIMCFVISLIMLFAAVGCGNDSGTQSQSGSTDNKEQQSNSGGSLSWEEVKATIPAEASGKTIEVLSWNKITDVTGAQQVVDNFTKETGINVKWTIQGNVHDYITKVVALVASQQSPDIVRLYTLDLGMLQVLQPLNKVGYDFTDSAWDKRVMDFYTINGNFYGTNMRNTLIQQPRTLIYNKNLISNYDLEDPYTLWKQGQWTLEKFEEICEMFTAECDETSYAWTSYVMSDIADLYAAPMVTRDKDGKFVSNMSDENLLKGWQKMTTYREEGITNNMRFDLTNFENGKVLFFSESPIGARTTHYYFSSLKDQGAIAIVPYPTVEGGTNAAMWGEVEAYAIPEGAKNTSIAPYFLRYYLDADNYDKNTFFPDKTILDVYESLMAAEEIFVNYDRAIITEDVGVSGDKMCHGLINMKPAQVNQKIDEYAPMVEAAANNANGIITKFD